MASPPDDKRQLKITTSANRKPVRKKKPNGAVEGKRGRRGSGTGSPIHPESHVNGNGQHSSNDHTNNGVPFNRDIIKSTILARQDEKRRHSDRNKLIKRAVIGLLSIILLYLASIASNSYQKNEQTIIQNDETDFIPTTLGEQSVTNPVIKDEVVFTNDIHTIDRSRQISNSIDNDIPKAIVVVKQTRRVIETILKPGRILVQKIFVNPVLEIWKHVQKIFRNKSSIGDSA